MEIGNRKISVLAPLAKANGHRCYPELRLLDKGIVTTIAMVFAIHLNIMAPMSEHS